MAWVILLFPFVILGIVTSFDELYYHRKRGLPRWERLGHPLDLLSFVFCWGWMATHDFNDVNLCIYIALSVFACVLSTKDEWVHTELCPPGEQWMHSMMFMFNPMVFFCGGFIWACAPSTLPLPTNHWQETAQLLYPLIPLNAVGYIFLLIYNFTYWHRRGDA